MLYPIAFVLVLCTVFIFPTTRAVAGPSLEAIPRVAAEPRVEAIRAAAERGKSGWQFILGHMYDFGDEGVEQDDAQAAYWYRKAAEQGSLDAQYRLGEKYKFGGEGVEQDDAQAVYWYRKAAEQGNPNAQFNIGLMYKYGRGVERDDAQATYWDRKLYENKIQSSEANPLVGLRTDDIRINAEHGDPSAQFSLGRIYDSGKYTTLLGPVNTIWI